MVGVDSQDTERRTRHHHVLEALQVQALRMQATGETCVRGVLGEEEPRNARRTTQKTSA